MSDFKDDRFFLEISDQKGQPIMLPDSERKVKIIDASSQLMSYLNYNRAVDDYWHSLNTI